MKYRLKFDESAGKRGRDVIETGHQNSAVITSTGMGGPEESPSTFRVLSGELATFATDGATTPGADVPVPGGQGAWNRPSELQEELAFSLNREIGQFRNVQAESMAVVLRPDRYTEIFCLFVLQHGNVAVQAWVERGDIEALRSDWLQLQMTLQKRDVSLGPLQESDEPSRSFTRGSQLEHDQRKVLSHHRGKSDLAVAGDDDTQGSRAPKMSEPRYRRSYSQEVRTSLEAWV